MSIDRLSNMVSMIKNASMAKKPVVEIMQTKECEAVAKVLKEAGFLSVVKTFKAEKASYKMLHLELAKDEFGDFILTDAIRVSKPGRRIYKNHSNIKKVANGFGLSVITTSRGIMSGDQARTKKLGGEIICEVK